jgi:hypothetical protein
MFKKGKKLNKDLVLAIDWAAAEYKYVEELYEQLEEIEKEKDADQKKLRKAVHLVHYISRAERRADRFEERFREKFEETYQEEIEKVHQQMEEHLEEDLHLKQIINSIREIAKELEVEHAHLVKYASFYDGLLEEELDKATIEAKLEEKIRKDNPEKAEKIHTAFLQLIKQIEEQVEDVEKWIRALEASLKKAQKVIKELPEEDKKHLEIDGMAILKKYDFPINRDQKYAQFLAQHPADLKEIEQAAGENVITIFWSFIAVKDLLEKGIISWNQVVNGFCKISHAAGKKASDIFFYGFYVVKDSLMKGIISWDSVVDGFCKISHATGKKASAIFKYGLHKVKDLVEKGIISWDQVVDSFCKISHALGEKIYFIFEYGIPKVKDLLMKKMISWDQVVDDFCKMTLAFGEKTYTIFKYGLPSVIDLLKKHPEYWPDIIEKLPKIIDYCKGKEDGTYQSLIYLKQLFDYFGVNLFDLLIFPTLKSQKVAAFLCFRSYGMIPQAIQTKEDIDVLIQILSKRKFKANDFFQHILINGIKENIIATPLSKEKEYLIPFLENSTVDLIEVYKEYKTIMSSDHPEKHLHLKKMFKELKTLQKDIFNGVLTKEYNPKMLLGILYSTFSPELTVPRENYEQTYNNRTDRQADIPTVLNKISPEEVKISRGGYALKSGEELDDEAWKILIEVVSEINSKPKKALIPERLGLALLSSFINKTLKKRRKAFLALIYQYSVNTGTGLPEFNTEHSTLMKYKEWVGDRLKNDLITTLIDTAYQKNKVKFSQLIGKVKKPKKYAGLAKTLFGLWMSKKEDKEVRIKLILEKNGFYAERIDWQVSKWQDVEVWLKQHQAGTISKKLISDIFSELTGEEYNQMHKQMDKFEHSHKASGKGGAKYLFMLSKKHPHSVAMYNFGVCVAPDDKLWNMSDFWQLIIWDNNFNGCGGVIYRTIEEGGKKYLIASIQPNSTILNEVSPVHLYDQIIKYSEKMMKKLKYDSLLIPRDGAINSNRGSIQAIITERNYPKKTLLKEYEFSYSPYHYKYEEFFIVG